MTIPEPGLSTEVNTFYKFCLIWAHGVGSTHRSFFFAGAEVKFILASGRDCYSGCICNNTEKTSLSYMSTSIAFISFAKGARRSDQSEFTFLHLPLKIQTLSAGAGRDRTSQPESNLKCGYNQEMDSSHQVIVHDKPNATNLQKKRQNCQ